MSAIGAKRRKPTRAMINKAEREHEACNARCKAAYQAVLDTTPHLSTERFADIMARAPEAERLAYRAAHDAREAFEAEVVQRGLAWRSPGWSLLNWY